MEDKTSTILSENISISIYQYTVWGKTWDTQSKKTWDRNQRNIDEKNAPAKNVGEKNLN